jgi:hypothetical protein
VLLGGIGTRTGEADRTFAGLLTFLVAKGRYDRGRDVLEGTFAGSDSSGEWHPAPYTPGDTRQPLIDLAEAVAGCLEWYRRRLPATTRLAVLGYSLGGVAGLDGATLAIARDRRGWHNRLSGVVTMAAPVRGSSVGGLVNWAWVVTGEANSLGAAGRDLDARWRDPEEQVRVERRAAFLRSAGARVLTLVDPDDSIVRPEEGLLPANGESAASLQIRTLVRRPGSLGHGAILDEPVVWQRILDAIGPQLDGGTSSPEPRDPLDDELKALKERMRREGRIT